MADRVLVVHEGRIAAELSRDEATAEAVMRAATGSADITPMVGQPVTSASTEEVKA
jgi:rhamnose transport system ATP-binding protein